MKTITKEPDEIDLKILRGFRDGMTTKEIAYEVGLKTKSITARISTMKKYYKCRNIPQLIHILSSIDKNPL